MDSPVLLSATFAVPVNSVRGLADSTQLQNPSRTAMWLDEIRVFAHFPQERSQADVQDINLQLRISLKLGRIPITNGFVPIALMGKVLNPTEFILEGNGGFHTWKLPKPLYIPAGEYLIPEIQHIGFASITDTPDIRITYAGRSLPSDHPRPPVLNFPWVTAYVTPNRGVGVFTDQSYETDLVNPFNEPLRVQRFVGDVVLADSNNNATRGNNRPACSIGSRFTTVRMANSNGAILVRDPTPFNHLFNVTDRTWTVNALLPPKGFYTTFLNQDYSLLDLSGVTITSMISMVGHREVKLQ